MAVYEITIDANPDVSLADIKELLAQAGEIIQVAKWREGDQ